MQTVSNRTKYSYSIGCIGRDMAYTLVNTFIIFFLTNGVGLTPTDGVIVGFIMLGCKVWDAINDPMMGTIVDNTRTRFGKFKPWIMTGAVINSVFTYLMFVDFGIKGVPFFVVFTVIYVLWGMSYTMNDIPYWSLLPALTVDQKEREKIGSLARIFANVGLFVATACVPLVYSSKSGSDFIHAFQIMAVVASGVFILCQTLVIVGVKQPKSLITAQAQKTNFVDAFKSIVKNDQLLIIVLSILLFNIGYFTTTSFGTYFFEYEMRNGGLFTVFAIVIGVSQVVALLVFPIFAKRFTRKKLFTIAIIAVAVGYAGFMMAGYVGGKYTLNMVYLSIIGVFMFAGQAFIQILALMLLSDTIEYGQWKNGTRNESVLFSLQPFVVKLASAIQAPITMITIAVTKLSFLNTEFAELKTTGDALIADKNAAIDSFLAQYPDALIGMRVSMIVVPLLLILAGFLVYMLMYKIDKPFYDRIISDLKERAVTEGVKIDGVAVRAEELEEVNIDIAAQVSGQAAQVSGNEEGSGEQGEEVGADDFV